MTTYTSFNQNPQFFADGLLLAMNATTPETSLDVAAGVMLDSTKTFEMLLEDSITIDAIANGLNGLDTGSLVNNSLYYVYLVSDPVRGNPTGALISLSASAPALPTGYSVFGFIGAVATDGSAEFIRAHWTNGLNGSRVCVYDSAVATAITAGASTSFVDINLDASVPGIEGLLVKCLVGFTPNAPAASGVLAPADAASVAVPALITGAVAAVNVFGYLDVIVKLSAGSATIKYLVSNAGDSMSVNVSGYSYSI